MSPLLTLFLCIITGIYTFASWQQWLLTREAVDLTRRSVESAEQSVAAAEASRQLGQSNLRAAQQSNELAVEALQLTRESNLLTDHGVRIAREEAEEQRREAASQRQISERNLQLLELQHAPQFVFDEVFLRDERVGWVRTLRVFNEGAPVSDILVRKANFLRLHRQKGGLLTTEPPLLIPCWFYSDASWEKNGAGFLGEMRSFRPLVATNGIPNSSYEAALRDMIAELNGSDSSWRIELLTFVGIWWDNAAFSRSKNFFQVIGADSAYNPTTVWRPLDKVRTFQLDDDVGEEIILIHNGFSHDEIDELGVEELVKLAEEARCSFRLYSPKAREILQAPDCPSQAG